MAVRRIITGWIPLLVLQFIQRFSCDPSWLDTPTRDVYVLPGDDVSMRWVYDLDGGQVERITWGIIQDNSMAQVIATQFQNNSVTIIPSFIGKAEVVLPGTLILKNATTADRNVYGCMIDTNTALAMFSTTTLTVLAQLPTIQTTLPTIQTVSEGDGPFFIEALIESDPGIKLTWLKDDVGIPSHYIVTTQVIGMTPEGNSIFKSVLQIPTIAVNDLGNFSLIGGFGDNIEYAVRIDTFVDVHYSPREMSFRQYPYIDDVPAGKSVNLTCTVRSNPPADVIISRPLASALNSPGTDWYLIASAAETDAGEYHCKAENGIGNSLLQALELSVTGEDNEKIWLYYLIAGLICLILIIILISIVRWRKRSIRKRTISERRNEVVGRANETQDSKSASLENLERTGTNGVNNGSRQ